MFFFAPIRTAIPIFDLVLMDQYNWWRIRHGVIKCCVVEKKHAVITVTVFQLGVKPYVVNCEFTTHLKIKQAIANVLNSAQYQMTLT